MADYQSYLEYLKHVEDVSQQTHRDEIAKAVEQKELEIKSLHDNYESKLKDKDSIILDLKTEIDRTKKNLGELYNTKSDEIRAKHREEIDDIISKAKAERDSMKSDMQMEIDRISAMLSEKQSVFKKQIVDIKSASESEKETLKSKMNERIGELEKEKNTLLDRLHQEEKKSLELQESLDSAMGPINKKIDDAVQIAIAKESEKHKNDISQLNTLHHQELKDKVDEFDKERKALELQIKEKESSHLAAVEKLKEQVRAEAETFKSEIEKGVRDLKNRIKDLESIVEQKDNEIKQLQGKQSKGLFGMFK